MKAILHSSCIDDYFSNRKLITRKRFVDSDGRQSMICEAKVICDGQEYYMSIRDSKIPRFRIGYSSVIDRGEEGFESDERLVSRCNGQDAYYDYGDTDFTLLFEALYQIMDEDDDSVVFKRSGDIVIGKYAIALRNDCWWSDDVAGILDALINSWGNVLPFAVGTCNEGPDMFVFSGGSHDVMRVVQNSSSKTRSRIVRVTDMKFVDFRESFIQGLKQFVQHPSREPEKFCQEYTEQFRRKIKRKLKAYERAKARYSH